jgi:hypothetical protein
MKLSDIVAGTRAIKRVPLALVNVSSPLVPEPHELEAQRASAVSEREIIVGLRVLSGGETVEILKRSRAYCVANGVPEPSESEPLYNLSVSVHKLAFACVDPDTDPKSPALFFGSTVEEAVDTILNSPHVGRDGIAYLDEQQELWQDQCNPQALKMSPDKLLDMVGEVARDAELLRRLRPGLRVIFAHFMANLLVSSPEHRSLFGAVSEPDSETSSSPSHDGIS